MTPISVIMKGWGNMKNEFKEEQRCSENTTEASGTDFFRWFHELERFWLRSERFYDDILPYIDEQKDPYAAAKMMIKWLEAAFEAGVKSAKRSWQNTKLTYNELIRG